MIAIFLFLFFLMAFGSYIRLDPDLGWHLFLGQKMAESKSLIYNAVGYNYFASLKIPDHEWLSDLILYQLSRIGMGAILVFFLIISSVLAFLLLRIAQKKTDSKPTILFALTLTVLALTVSFGLRLQVLLFLAVALFIYLRLYVTDYKARYLFYFLMTTVGINLHGGFLTLLPIPLLLEFPLERFGNWRRINYKGWLFLFFVLGIATVFNPYGLKYWQLVLSYSSNTTYMMHISEWLPIYCFPICLWNIIIPLSIVIFCFIVNNYWHKLPLNQFLLIILYGYLAIRFRRYFPIFLILILPMFILALENLKINVFLSTISRLIPVIVIVMMTTLFLIANWENHPQINIDPTTDPYYPADASQFLTQNGLTKDNLLNPYLWGGYLLWKNPNQKVFIDGRGPQTKIDDKNSLLDEDEKFNSDNQKIIVEQLSRYNINSVLVDLIPNNYDIFNTWLLKLSRLDSQKQTGTSNLNYYLSHSADWQKVYEDNISVIYFKKNK